MVNEAYFSVTGYVATTPRFVYTRDGTRMLTMRVGWTPRRFDRATEQWIDQQSSFISVQCFRKVADHAGACLHRGDPIVLKGSLRVREYPDQAGVKRISVDVLADSIGHDMSRGISFFTRPAVSSEQTAAERERAMVAEGRSPLPGDRPVPAGGELRPADGSLAGAGAGLAGPQSLASLAGREPAGTQLADAELADAELADADLTDDASFAADEADPDDADLDEAGPDEADPDEEFDVAAAGLLTAASPAAV